MNKYQKELEKWCLNSTMDGLPSIVRAKRHLALFVFWLLLFTACLGLCIYMVCKSIMSYYNYDVITTDRIIARNRIDFPIVTFCNQNPLLHPRANDYARDYFRTNLGLNLSSLVDLAKQRGVENATNELLWMLYQTIDPKLNDTVRKLLGYSAQETFFVLLFDGEPVNLTTDLEWFFDPSQGNCWRFNPNSGKPGSFSSNRMGIGLYAEIFTGLPYSLHRYFYESDQRGIVLEIKNPDNYSFVNKKTLLQPGKTTHISLSKTKSTILPKPYSNCNSEGSFSTPVLDEMKRLGLEYDLNLCILALIQFQTVKTLDCYDLRLSPMFNESYPACLNRSSFDSFNLVPIDGDLLLEMCPPDCGREVFGFSLAAKTFPMLSWFQSGLFYYPDYFENIFGSQNVGFDSIKSSFAAVSIDFKRIAVEEVSEKPAVELVDLLSNIGGTMGLYIGPSLLTLTELFELGIAFVVVWLANKRLIKQKARHNQIQADVDKKSMNGNIELQKITYFQDS